MDSHNIQRKIFEIIEIKSKDPKSLKDDLALLLNISKGAVYKRMNGTTAISIGDLFKISKHYNVNLDQIINPDRKEVKFVFPQLQKRIV